jgi:hypothetical protein
MTERINRHVHSLFFTVSPRSGTDLQHFFTKAFRLLWAFSFTLTLAAPGYAGPFTASNPATLPTATIWLVGPERKLRTPSEAVKLAKSGDTIEIDAGIYRNDYAAWGQENLTIRGVGGMAHLQSTELIPNGKAIWIVSGNNTVIENVEFSGARVKDTNGAAIRHEGGDLTLRNTYFHHNEFSILTGAHPEASLEILSSRFWFQKREGTFSHGMYIGTLKRFTLTGSHVKGTDRGHQIKSRALENHIQYNRIEDVAEGNSSRLVDLPNCGLSYIIGNDMQQAETTENIDAIGYGAEGCDDRSARQRRLFVVNNTFVNEAMNGTLVKNHADGEVLVANNLIFGGGYFLLGKGVKENNVAINLNFRQPGSWAAPPDSAAIDAALALPDEEGASLAPAKAFSPPLGTVPRTPYGAPDIGSRERPKAAASSDVSQ